jgi:predicted flap endonuclease-1-like 5' DNA nuclease
MTQNELIFAIAAIVALALATIAYVWLRRGQRVDLTPVESKIQPTLARDAPPPSPILPSVARGVTSGESELRLLKGVGPRLVTRLGELGFTRFDQLASLDAAGVAALDAQLGTFAGRIIRDNWVEQASLLAQGDIALFEAKYGKLNSESA